VFPIGGAKTISSPLAFAEGLFFWYFIKKEGFFLNFVVYKYGV